MNIITDVKVKVRDSSYVCSPGVQVIISLDDISWVDGGLDILKEGIHLPTTERS